MFQTTNQLHNITVINPKLKVQATTTNKSVLNQQKCGLTDKTPGYKPTFTPWIFKIELPCKNKLFFLQQSREDNDHDSAGFLCSWSFHCFCMFLCWLVVCPIEIVQHCLTMNLNNSLFDLPNGEWPSIPVTTRY